MGHRALIFLILLSNTFSLTAQRGPGGVSVDTDNQKNCRLWLDAGDLTHLADGDNVTVWYDKSISLVNDSAFWDSDDAAIYLPPIFRDAPAASINGKPVISFESGGMLSVGSWDGGNSVPPSIDLNSNPGVLTTYEQTMFFAFRTSNNVTDRQIIWEEGGSDRGFAIYILNGEVYIGAYDDRVDSDPGDGNVPEFGFTYKKLPVQANTTYILSFVYDVPTGAHGNVLITNSFNPAPSLYSGLTGSLNGVPFPTTMITGCCRAAGVGGVFTHPDPIGIGGFNRTSYDETGDQNNQALTGTRLFTGRLAEICYYAFAMNDAERIIVENYLAAKYFANVIQNDKYIYEANYGDGVIGIGRQQSTPVLVEHNISQGDNLFEIKVGNMNTAFPNSPQYLLVGHNNSFISWTNQNVTDSLSIQRLRRIWRWDRTGVIPSNKSVTITLHPQDIAKLPPLPAGFTKYGLMIDGESQFLPNFEAQTTQVYELVNNGSGTYSATIDVDKGDFMTIVAIKPSAQFRVTTDFAIEGDAGSTADFVWVDLNYQPSVAPNFVYNVNFTDGTASFGADYTYNSSNETLTFSSTAKSRPVGFSIIGDLQQDVNPIQDFNIQLVPSNPAVAGVGSRNVLNFKIYDNDPPPKATFQADTLLFSEGDGTIKIPVEILGAFSNSATVTVEFVPGGSALIGQDFTVTSPQILNFTPAVPRDSFVVSINDDLLDEFEEYFNLSITDASSGIGFDNTVTLNSVVGIVDNDPLPTVSFLSANSEGYETVSDPRIYAQLNTPSAKEVVVPFSLVGGTAINDAVSPGGDYSADPAGGAMIFPPGSIEQYLYYNDQSDQTTLIVYGNDAPNEPDETILFQLNPNPTNAVLGNIINHTYTIREYSEFEWLGVAGVGKFQDNTFWMVPDAAASGNAISNIPNLSPRPVQLFQDVSAQRPTVTSEASGRNNQKLIDFNGTSHNLKVGSTGSLEGQFPLINSGGLYDRKSIFMVIIPDKVNSSTPQVIYEQGGGTRGISIYIIQNKLYFYAWNDNNDGAYSPWGLNGSNLGITYVQSTTDLVAGQPYIISCHYSRNWGVPAAELTPLSGLHLYVNGVKEASYTGQVGRLYTHSGRTCLGSAWHQFRAHNTSSTGPSGTNDFGNWFDGKIGEVLYFNEPRMNEARVAIIHNYLSARYNIPLGGGIQSFDLTYANNTNSTNPDFNRQVAGVGRSGSAIHGDSQGLSELRVRNPNFASTNTILTWGHNGESLTNTWPYVNSALPASIYERSGRIWRFSNNQPGGVTNADIHIRFAASGNANVFSSNPSLLKLLIHSNSNPQDFSNATIRNISAINSGNIAVFSNVPITNGMYIALGNTSTITPLPIELLYFDAEMNNGIVDLTWATASELNNDYFVVERAGEDMNWKKIIVVPGSGNSNTEIVYSEKDRRPLPGVSYYRLKQVDFDGSFVYSDPVSVFNTDIQDEDQVFMYPNPLKTGQDLLLRIPYGLRKHPARIAVYDLGGKLVHSSTSDSEADIIMLDLKEIQSGIYLVHILSDVINETKKLVIQ